MCCCFCQSRTPEKLIKLKFCCTSGADYEEEEIEEEVEEEVPEEAPSGAAPKVEQEEGAAIQEDFLYHLSLAVKHKLGEHEASVFVWKGFGF